MVTRYKRLIFYIVLLLVILATVLFVYTYREKISRVLSPFLISVLLVYIVKPLSDRLTAKKFPVGVSVLLVYLFILSLLAAVSIYFIPELTENIRELLETLPQLVSDYENILNDLFFSINSSNWSDQVKNVVFEQIANVIEQIQSFLLGILENGLKLVVDMFRIIVDITVALVITYYVIKDGKRFREFALSMLPARWRGGLTGVGMEINRVLNDFVQGQLMIALVVAILETIGLMIIGMRYPLALGMIGGLANVIPYFGPYIGAIPAVAIALTVSPVKAVWTAIVFIFVQQIDNSFISPKMIEGRLGLHPVATIFVIFAGGEFFGIPGMLLAVPVMAILRILVNKIVEAVV